MDSYLTAREGKVTGYVGKDAVELFRAIAIRGGLQMYAKCGMIPNRGWTITKMLAAAGGVTHKKYRRGQAQLAADDLTKWIDTMRAALPVEHQETPNV